MHKCTESLAGGDSRGNMEMSACVSLRTEATRDQKRHSGVSGSRNNARSSLPLIKQLASAAAQGTVRAYVCDSLFIPQASHANVALKATPETPIGY